MVDNLFIFLCVIVRVYISFSMFGCEGGHRCTSTHQFYIIRYIDINKAHHIYLHNQTDILKIKIRNKKENARFLQFSMNKIMDYWWQCFQIIINRIIISKALLCLQQSVILSAAKYYSLISKPLHCHQQSLIVNELNI